MIVPHTKQCKNVAQVSIHRPSPLKVAGLLALFALAYALALPQFLSTMGAPLERALLEIKLQDANKTVDVFDDAPLESVIDIGGEEEEAAGLTAAATPDLPAPSSVYLHGNASASGNDTDDGGVAAAARPLLVLTDEDRRLPSRFLPDALPMFVVLVVCSLNAVYFLLCRWSVWFKVSTQYEPAKDVGEGRFAMVEAMENRGMSSLVPITRNPVSRRLEFAFQRQVYEYQQPEQTAPGSDVISLGRDASAEDDDGKPSARRDAAEALAARHGYFRVVLAKVDLPVSEYLASPGLRTEQELAAQRLKFGPNTLSVAQPPFSELLKAQLLMPLSVFQLFSALLWAIDEYIQYTLFTVFTIVMMESATAYQRHRTMLQLSGLSPKPFSVMARRGETWQHVASTDLLPGDIISLRLDKSGSAGSPAAGSDVVPCDALILQGAAIVNEATLTGESVPQMKDALVPDPPSRALAIDGADRIHTVFSGTSLVAVTPPDQPGVTPDGGCLCVVLRTGFGSSQGELMQMIEYSQKQVSADNWETALSLGILLVFGVASATYAFNEGLKRKDKTTHELLLRAIITVTNVVPRQLPVQMALQVNHALMTLMKEGIFCTEPYRVPQAGKITHALFDKTGTLTSDELVPCGVLNAPHDKGLGPFASATGDSQLVLAVCHSLVSLPASAPEQQEERKLVGDPIELAAVKALQWGVEGAACTPGDVAGKLKLLDGLRERIGQSAGDAAYQAQLNSELVAMERAIAQIQARARALPYSSATILRRFHFDAALQRMSVLAKVKFRDAPEQVLALVKGSPEAIKALLAPGQTPDWYDREYLAMAERGMRVLALAMRPMPAKAKLEHVLRVQVESELNFVGFVAFECKVRADSAAVIAALGDAAIRVAMVTGDAPLTALSVARDCKFLHGTQPALILQKDGKSWRGALRKDEALEIAADWRAPDAGLGALKAQGHDLLVTETALEALSKLSDGRVWQGVHHVPVFARMSPPGKARVIRSIQKSRADGLQPFVLMCGDGGNDVGALKQADVGLALLSGYGSANTAGVVAADGQGAEGALNLQVEEERKRLDKFGKLKAKALEVKRKELAVQQRVWVQEEMDKLGPNAGVLASVGAVKAAALRFNAEMQKESALLDKKYGGMAMAGQDSLAAAGLEEQGLPVVRPGDASVAAPFTSRVPSVRSVVHLIRQGRCTLLGALQQHETMMIECAMHAYTHALISLEGSRSSERQLMVSGWLIMAAALAFSYAVPTERMHPCKPLRSIYQPAVLVSLLGQCFIHLAALTRAAQMAKDAMGPELLAQVVAFNKKVQAGTLKETERMDEDDPLKQFTMMWSQPFMPNLMNTTVFLVETAQIVAVFIVNYKGRPFMRGIMENHVLFMSLFTTVFGVAFCAWEVLPQFNHAVHFHPFPSDEYRFRVLALIAQSLLGTFLFDRLALRVFAPEVFWAVWEEAVHTHWTDLLPIFWTLLRAVVGFGLLATGNPVIWAGAWYFNKKFMEWYTDMEEKRIKQMEAREAGRRNNNGSAA